MSARRTLSSLLYRRFSNRQALERLPAHELHEATTVVNGPQVKETV
jgi:hypothetical protein